MHEGIVEVVIRGGRKGVERTLEGWRVKDAGEANQSVEACLCGDLEVVRAAAARAGVSAAKSLEATTEVSFRSAKPSPWWLTIIPDGRHSWTFIQPRINIVSSRGQVKGRSTLYDGCSTR